MPTELPSPEEAALLPLDQLALRLLAVLREQANAGTMLHIRNVINRDHWSRRFERQDIPAFPRDPRPLDRSITQPLPI